MYMQIPLFYGTTRIQWIKGGGGGGGGGGGRVQGQISWRHDFEIPSGSTFWSGLWGLPFFRAQKSKMVNKDQSRDLLPPIDRL